MGAIRLLIPELREGSYFPSLLEPRRRSEHALVSVIQEAYVAGVSTRKVDRLAKALGMDGISRSQVSRVCQELSAIVEKWRQRSLEDEPIVYLWLDGTTLEVRENERVVSVTAVVAVGVTADGRRTILGFDVGASESRAFWPSFLRSLVARGLDGVLLVISDAHEGLKEAIAATMSEATWQRCRVHYMRNVLGRVKKGDADEVMNAIRSIFAQTDVNDARRQLRTVADRLRKRHPDAADKLEEAEADLLAYSVFPRSHWRKIWSNNLLERLLREVKRRTNVVGIFPNRDAVIRLVGMVLLEQDEEWQAKRRYMSEASMQGLTE